MMKPEKNSQTNHDTYSISSRNEIKIGNTRFIVESVFGSEPLNELMTDYIAGQIKEKRTEDDTNDFSEH